MDVLDRIERLDAEIRWWRESLEELARRWKREMTDLVAQGITEETAARIEYFSELAASVRAQLNQLGYRDLARRFVRKFEDSDQSALDSLKELGSPRLAPLDEGALAALRHIEFQNLLKIGQDTVQAVASGTVKNVLGGMRRSEMIEHIASTIDAKFVNLASTYADTALVSYDRRVHWEAWTAAGVERLLYDGPKDVKNRPFCEERVGRAFSREQIEKMDNGTRLMPVSLYGGGWNCRHVWTPALEKG